MSARKVLRCGRFWDPRDGRTPSVRAKPRRGGNQWNSRLAAPPPSTGGTMLAELIRLLLWRRRVRAVRAWRDAERALRDDAGVGHA
jgi:hypothetical protein